MPDGPVVRLSGNGPGRIPGTFTPEAPAFRAVPDWIRLGPQVTWTIGAFAIILTYYAMERGDTIGADRSPIVLLVYLIPFLLLAECYARKALFFRSWAPWAMVAWGFYAGLGIIDNGGFHKEIYFAFATLLAAAIKFQTRPWVLILFCVVGFAALVGLVVFKGLPLVALTAAFSVKAVQVELENSLGLTLGLVVLAAYAYRKPGVGIVSLLLMMSFSKRVSLVGIALVLLADLASLVLRTGNKDRLRRTTTFIVVSLCAAIGVNAPAFYEMLSSLLWRAYGLSVNATYLSTGRYFALLGFQKYDEKHTTFLQVVFGHGIGHATRSLEHVLSASFRINYPLLHDDWLRIVSDFGYLGVGLTVIAFTKMGQMSRLGAMFAIYTAVLFITDNVFSYVTYWFTLFICLNINASRRLVARIRPTA